MLTAGSSLFVLTTPFNQDRHLNRRDIFKQTRSAALAEWRQLAA
jgi:hypothetical protein